MKTAIAWFARNGVAANLLFILIFAGAFLSVSSIKREVFPEIATNTIVVSVLYPGAAPEEVEEAVCMRVEEAVESLEGVKRLTSAAGENTGTVTIEALEGTDLQKLLDEVKSRVDGIETFPEETEKPIVQDIVLRSQVINVAVSGQADERTLKRIGEQVRDELQALPEITQVSLTNARPYEISIELSEEQLQSYGLSFSQVSAAVRRSSLDLPGGAIKTEGGEVLLRTKGQAYTRKDFEKIVVRTDPNGTRILLKDVATVIDGFAETDQFARFNGEPSVMLQVFRVGDQDAIEISSAVHAYVDEARFRYPEGISLTTWQDQSEFLKGRQQLLFKNGITGFILVFLVLSLFLRFRLAFWVSAGLVFSFMGALFLMPILGVSINLISLFAFIIVLGIVVDDAIVVGESIYQEIEGGNSGIDAAVEGTNRVAVPVIFAVLTTVAAFSPLLGIPGRTGQIMQTIPMIVIPTLLFSLVESKLILPNHLSHLKPSTSGLPRPGISGLWTRMRRRINHFQEILVERSYKPSLSFAVRWRYLTLAGFSCLLLITVGLIGSGRIAFTFFPKVESDTVVATLTLPLGTPVATTSGAVAKLEAAAEQLRTELGTEENGDSVVKHMLSSIGSQPFTQAQANDPTSTGFSAAHLAEVSLELAPSETRTMSSPEIASRWRELVGEIPGGELSFQASLFSAGSPIDVQLAGPDMVQLQGAADRLKEHLGTYQGVFDITDSYQAGKMELLLQIKPEAEALGLSLSDLAAQVRAGFYGEEAQRIQRGRDEVKVMVRYPKDRRHSLAGLENMRVRTQAGGEVPFSAVATAELGRGYATISRADRNRTISVLADVDEDTGNANEILASVQATFLPQLLSEFPGVTYSFEGEQQQQRETMGGLRRGFMFALIIIYTLMAIPFRSYTQPLVVMLAIPFGLVGAIWGHMLLGMNLTILSMFGIVALSGVVVNDSIVLVDQINVYRRSGMSLEESVLKAGPKRFRAILLTSLTTVAGLTPMLLEKSVQAQFLIPIAVSLAFGVLFATFIILLMVPASYLVLHDILNAVQRAFRFVFTSPQAEVTEP